MTTREKLPVKISMRPYHHEADLTAITTLQLSIERDSDFLDTGPSVSDLRALLQRPDRQANTRVFEADSGDVVAFVILRLPPYGNLLFHVHPKFRDGSVESQLFDWATAQVRLESQRLGIPARFNTHAHERDLYRCSLLERYGFVRQTKVSLTMVRLLEEPIAEPQLPAGFSIRNLREEDEVKEYVLLRQQAFGTSIMSVEQQLAKMREPDYAADLDLVVLAPDGRFAAFCACTLEANAKTGVVEGWPDPVGTRPEFRKRGLARAVLLAALRKLKKRGVSHAYLTTDEPIPQRLYESVGFQAVDKVFYYTKEI